VLVPVAKFVIMPILADVLIPLVDGVRTPFDGLPLRLVANEIQKAYDERQWILTVTDRISADSSAMTISIFFRLYQDTTL